MVMKNGVTSDQLCKMLPSIPPSSPRRYKETVPYIGNKDIEGFFYTRFNCGALDQLDAGTIIEARINQDFCWNPAYRWKKNDDGTWNVIQHKNFAAPICDDEGALHAQYWSDIDK